MSNIINVFNPPPSRSLGDEECLGCTAVQSVVCLGGGGYFLSSLPFKGKNGTVDLRKHPIWFQRGVRGVGIGLVALGMYRLGEVVQIYSKRRRKEEAALQPSVRNKTRAYGTKPRDWSMQRNPPTQHIPTSLEREGNAL
ncbi:uncharacterized protein CXQ87_004969 [Candidozyma duobushaemuli]|uniref:DUF4536 domain-containing protein n=1 Tax=Candidozyma duobushaemuli TaxID=1231522 RepID=A0A2V1AHI7_9ASCO|nr:uncharacterized protein CXQ87_004969 [[Candida] duobushaemulonis]PVH16673.1 hypothetical protein CXQ87_004969 [[Candida] duobushaemulonis]